MKNILSSAQREVLALFTRRRVLVGLDFDGTLAPIVADPARARMRAGTRQLLHRVCERYPVVVISGRAQTDVRERLGNAPVNAVVGNHGLEPASVESAAARAAWRRDAERYARQVEGWKARLSRDLATQRGVVIEDKTYSLSVHYRGAPRRGATRATIVALASALRGARVVGGKLVVNITPVRAPHKGTALERERRRLGCDAAIYVGDDDTDEDVFALGEPRRLLSIRVGKKAASAAPYFVASQAEIDGLLRALVELRCTPGA